MARTIRKLFARVLTGGACLLPLAAPGVAAAQTKPAATESAPTKTMTSKELHQHLAKASGWIQTKDAFGTGWIVDAEKKLMITNDHVVDGVDAVAVVFPIWKDGKLVMTEAAYKDAPKVKGVVIDRDENRDLALIKLESIPAGMHALRLAAEEPDAGDEIRTIGAFTKGGDGLVWGAVSGVVRTVGPQDMDPDRRRRAVPVREVLSDARTNGGNSGAPVVNMGGEVVGVHFAWKPWAKDVTRHVSVVEVKAFLKEAIPMADPKTADQFLARAKRRLANARWDSAAADASAALVKNPKLAEALYVRGRAFLSKKDPQTALEDFAEAVALDPGNYEYRVGRGRANRDAKKTADALADFSAAIRLDPSRAGGYNHRGLTHFFAAKYPDAEADFGRAIDAEPGDPVFWGNRADARDKQKKHEDAAGDWAKAADLAPANAGYANSCGLALYAAGKYDAAAKVFAEAAKRSGDHPLHVSNAADALRMAGNHKLAIDLYTLALEKWLDKDARYTPAPGNLAFSYAGRGMSQGRLKQPQKAVEDLSKAIEVTGGKVAWHFAERADAHAALGNRAAAAEDLATAEKLGYKVPAATPAPRVPPTPRAIPAPAAGAAPQLVGTWAGGYVRNGAKMAKVITLKADGTYELAIGVAGKTGPGDILTDTGTWGVAGKALTLNGKALGKATRPFEVSNGQLKLDMQELGLVLTMGKQ